MKVSEKLKCGGCLKAIAFDENSNSNGGKKNFSSNLVSKCKKCDSVYCIDCDLFINESLKFCPNCAQT